MTDYLEMAKRVKSSTAEATKAPAPAVNINTARVHHTEDERRLLAAGWTPKERMRPTIWANPKTGFYYSQEVALLCLERESVI